MRFTVEKLTPEMWQTLSSNARLIAFNEISSPQEDRIDYALLIVDEGKPAGYMTVKEMDATTAYIQHGGVFPDHAKSIHVFTQYAHCIAALSKDYKSLWTRVENKNLPMLKMAMKAGFVPVGTYYHKPKLFLELLHEVC